MLRRSTRIKRKYLQFGVCGLFLILLISVLIVSWNYNIHTSTDQDLATRFDYYVNSTLVEYEKILNEYEGKIIWDLGANGEEAVLEGVDARNGDVALKKYALNTVISDRMPLNRTLKDPRNVLCNNLTYKTTLRASVIVIFFNELRSVILRTVWSVLLRTPPHLLLEIILVDDASTDESVKGVLDYYVETRLSTKVRTIRLRNRMGLIRARLEGARRAHGDILVFLDAHCEVTENWAEPLIGTIELNRTNVVVPIIDVIEANNFAYSTYGQTTFQIGGFSWSGHFTWIEANFTDGDYTKPVPSPTMAGGLFAIDRHYFWEIGSYDEQMDGWGGENLEMSFRIWQCGGTLLTVPCSRVGHVFRDFHPYSFPQNRDTHALNTARLAHVWMDAYKRFYFMYQPQLANPVVVGDLTHRQQLRRKLRCHNFKWYLDNVYPTKFVPDENVYGSGQVRNEFSMCLDDLQLPTGQINVLGLYQCHPNVTVSQFFALSATGELRKEDLCAHAHSKHTTVRLVACHDHQRDQYWILYRNRTIYHPYTKQCLSSVGVHSGDGVIIEPCMDSAYQRWWFTHVNRTAVVL